MARLPYLDKTDLLPEHQDILARDINVYRLIAHSPRGARSWHNIVRYLRDGSRLDSRLRQLAILQVGYLTRSDYEWSHHVKIGREFRVSDADIRAIADETAGRPSSLEPLARAVLRGAREMTTGLTMTDETFAELRDALGPERLTDLVMTIAFYNGVVRMLATLDVDVEDDYRRYLEEFPLPKG